VVDDCAICARFVSAVEDLRWIQHHLEISTRHSSKKFDFGLYLSALQGEIGQLLRLFTYHEDYHRGNLREELRPKPKGKK